MIRIYSSILLILLFISGCFSESQKENIKKNKPQIGDIEINYFSDKSVTSLEVPPDLTAPSYENSFRLSEYVDVNSNTVNLTDKNIEDQTQKIKEKTDVRVMKSRDKRWLIVEKNANIVWNLTKDFLIQNGFKIKKSNKKIGIMETDFLENKPELPAQSVGIIRSFISSQIDNVSYALPSVDSYRIRIEPINEFKTELHLTLSSMEEVVQGSGRTESTIWQSKTKDSNLEIEMLYRLMIFLGSDSAEARERIMNSKDQNKIIATVQEGLNGYAKLVFNLNFIETWDNISWAIDQLNIDIEDKDIKERSFYIRSALPEDTGILTKIFGDEAVKGTYQLNLKNINPGSTEVYFNDIAEKNSDDLKKYSFELFNNLSKLFN